LIADLHRLADLVAAGEEVAEELPPTALADLLKSTPTPAAMVAEPSSFRTMTELDQELAQVFQTEATEILDSSDIILQRLRGELDNVELLNNLRREMHTLKGSSRMAGFMMVGDLAHAAESVLDALSKGVSQGGAVHPGSRSARPGQPAPDVGRGRERRPPQPQPALIDELHGVARRQTG
jgi:chemosensory pili system protein ChpA (sensor histidine kinase/response regulator)